MSSTEALSGDALSATSGAESEDVFMSDSDFHGSSSAAGALSGSGLSAAEDALGSHESGLSGTDLHSDAPISDLDSDMNDEDRQWAEDEVGGAASGIESTITVIIDDQDQAEEKIEVQAGMSFGDILEMLKKKGHEVDVDWALYDDKENELDRDDFASGYIGQTIYAKWQSFEVIIKDCMCTSPGNPNQDGIICQASQQWTGNMLSEYVFVQTQQQPVQLTHEGRQIYGKLEREDGESPEAHATRQEEFDKKTLAEFGIKHDRSRQEDIIILGRMNVVIVDGDCELKQEVMCLPTYSVRDLIDNYCQKASREVHEDVELTLNGMPLELDGDNLFKAGILPNTELYYKVPEYEVLITDSDEVAGASAEGAGEDDRNFVSLKVYDFWTVKEIKNAYEQITQKPFMPGDRILIEVGGIDRVTSAGQQLEDGMKLFKLRIKNKEKLNIEREEQAVAFGYQCANCGALVRLKRADAVQCRECFHRILFKSRTRRVCQYNCR